MPIASNLGKDGCRGLGTVMTICPLFATTTLHVHSTEFDDIADLTPEYILFVELCRLNPVIHGTTTKVKQV
jgi:hypothetical protein